MARSRPTWHPLAAKIRLRLKLGGGLAVLAGGAERVVELDEPAPLRQVAELAGVSPAAVMLYAVNGAVCPPEFCPADGDEVTFIPAVSGG